MLTYLGGKMNPTVARGKDGLHYIVRSIDKGKTTFDTSALSADALNKVLLAKTVGNLFWAISLLPEVPLLPKGVMEKQFTAAQFLEAVKKGEYSEIDSKQLKKEVFFDSNPPLRKPETPLGSKLNLHLMCFDSIESTLKELDSNKRILVEPIANWSFARNITSITARLTGYITTKQRAPLEAAGFQKCTSKKAFYIPFLHYPSFKKGIDSTYCPLLDILTTPCITGEARQHYFNSEKTVYLTNEPLSQNNDKCYYLCIADTQSQSELAKRLVMALYTALRDAKYVEGTKSISIGWSEEMRSTFETPALPAHGVDSLFASIIHRIAYRGSNEIALCKDCGCAILRVNKHGPREREFCSSTCRMRVTRRKKKGA